MEILHADVGARSPRRLRRAKRSAAKKKVSDSFSVEQQGTDGSGDKMDQNAMKAYEEREAREGREEGGGGGESGLGGLGVVCVWRGGLLVRGTCVGAHSGQFS